MHHKFVIVDDQLVLTGSYNFTHSAAAYNFENMVVVNESSAVREYIKEFKHLKAWPW
jgi:cardiolipin hydrolase